TCSVLLARTFAQIQDSSPGGATSCQKAMHPQPICVQLTAMTSKARSGTRNRWFQNVRGLLRALVFALPVLLASGEAWSKPKVHVVYQGQRLGSIAKRYNVTVDELCAANG